MFAVLCFMVGIACLCDYGRGKIPNALLIGMFAIGWICSVVTGGAGTGIFFLLRSACVLGLFYPLFKIGALGAGDVKLYGVCAGYLPGNTFLFFLFFSLLIAAAFSLVKMMKEANAVERFCYFCEYVVAVAKSGKFSLYLENDAKRHQVGICMAGPILGSLILHLGGVY